MLDYRVHTFLTLYQEMNYRRTAELLNMTQPGVTQHIQALERVYGVKLFQYDGRNLRRTPEAEILKKHLSAIDQREKALLSELHRPATVLLRVGATKTVGEFLIPAEVCRFLQAENQNLELTVDNTHALLDALDRGALDFAIIEGSFDKAKYDYHLFKKERFTGICARTHPFAGKRIGWQALFQENLILREPGSGTRGIFTQLLTAQGYSLEHFRRVSSVSSFSVIRQLVAAGAGLTFAYRCVADADERLTSFELEDLTITNELNYVYFNRQIAQEKIRQFRGIS